MLPGLATGALSNLGNFEMDITLGQGQTEGFLIPHNKIAQLIALKHLLTAKEQNFLLLFQQVDLLELNQQKHNLVDF